MKKNVGHLGFGGHFEFCNHDNFYVRHIVLIQCMSVCDFVFIRLTDFELEAKTWFWNQILGKIWPLTSIGRGHFLWNLRNAFTGLFVESRCLFMSIFVQIGLAGSEGQAQTWFLGQFFSKIDLWPLHVGSNFVKCQNCLYILVCRVKSLARAHFWPNRTCRMQTTIQNVISGSIFFSKIDQKGGSIKHYNLHFFNKMGCT